jgi:hypothetical protein
MEAALEYKAKESMRAALNAEGGWMGGTFNGIDKLNNDPEVLFISQRVLAMRTC